MYYILIICIETYTSLLTSLTYYPIGRIRAKETILRIKQWSKGTLCYVKNVKKKGNGKDTQK